MNRRKFICAGATLAVATVAGVGDRPNATQMAWDQLKAKADHGTVSMEELRGYFGDRIPGFVGVAARGLGVAPPELLELVRHGKVRWGDLKPS